MIKFLEIYKHFLDEELDGKDVNEISPWIIRFTFDKTKMSDKGIIMEDVYLAIMKSYSRSLNNSISLVTVILFDKLKDTQKSFKISNLTSDVLNKTFNEVLMRSINTSLTSAIPIISIIVIGNYLGIEGNLADFAIPLLIGLSLIHI